MIYESFSILLYLYLKLLYFFLFRRAKVMIYGNLYVGTAACAVSNFTAIEKDPYTVVTNEPIEVSDVFLNSNNKYDCSIFKRVKNSDFLVLFFLIKFCKKFFSIHFNFQIKKLQCSFFRPFSNTEWPVKFIWPLSCFTL